MASFKEIVPDMNRLQHTPQVAVEWFEGAMTSRATPLHQWSPCSRETLPYGQTGLRQDKYRRVERSHPREAESTGSGGIEDPRRRPTAATLDPGDADDAALSQSRPEAA